MAAVFVAVAGSIGTAIAATGIGVYTSALIASTITGVIVVAGTRAVLGELAPDTGGVGDYDSKSKSILLNKRSNNAPIPVVYGTRLVGGTVVFLAAGNRLADSSKYIFVHLVVSEGEVEEYTDIYLNGISHTDDKYQSIPVSEMVLIQTFFGTDTQPSAPAATVLVNEYTSQHRLLGTAYLAVRLAFTPEVFSGVPVITTLMKGVKVFDPRSSLTSWSDNPVLCVRDYLTNTRYGRGIILSEIDDASFIVAANYCDELVSLSGQAKKRYTCDGVVQTENSSLDILRELLTSCRGFLVYSGGKYKLIIDKPEIPVFTFSEDNIVGKWDIVLGNKNTMFNRIRANFFNKDKEYEPDIVVIDSPTLRTQDNGVLLERMINLPFTSDIARAKMIATINLNQSRQSINCEFSATIEGMLAEVGDVVYIKHDTPGWSELNGGLGKKFRVMKIVLQNIDEVRIQVREYDELAFSYSVVELPAAPDTTLPDLSFVGTPINITARESLYTTTNSAGLKSSLDIEWEVGVFSFVDYYEVSYLDNGISKLLTNILETSVSVLDIKPDVYIIQVRAVNTLGVRSEWAVLNNVIVAGLTSAPTDVKNFTAQVTGTTITLRWDLATDVDVLSGGTVKFKHSTETEIVTIAHCSNPIYTSQASCEVASNTWTPASGASWQNSVSIPTVAAGSSNSILLPLQVGTYSAKFVDSSVNESLNSAIVVVEAPVDIIEPQVAITLTQQPTFSGNKMDMAVVSNELQLDNSIIGTYEFDTYGDLGSVQVGRVLVESVVNASLISDDIDDRLILIDDWNDFDNLSTDVSLEIYISTTNDDPSGSPSWSTWARFSPADYKARAFRFKLEVITGSLQNQINIQELAATISTL